MTEKRFWLSPIVYDGEQRFVRDKSLIGEKSMSNNEVVDLLNELSDENEQLKQDKINLHRVMSRDRIRYLNENEQLKKSAKRQQSSNNECAKLIQEQQKENEQLKSTINTLTHDNTKMKKVLNTTKKENEHIKNTIQEAYNNERTKLGQSVLKQLMEAIQ